MTDDSASLRDRIELLSGGRCRSRGAHGTPRCMCAVTRGSDVHVRDFARRCTDWGCTTASRGGGAAPKSEAVTGATPRFRCPVSRRGGLGCASPSHPPRGSLRTSSPLREGKIGAPGRGVPDMLDGPDDAAHVRAIASRSGAEGGVPGGPSRRGAQVHTGGGVGGVASRASVPLREAARKPRGSQGGGALPSPAATFQRCVGWLTDLKGVGQPRGTPAKNVPPGIARNKLDQAVAGRVSGLSVASLTGDEGDGQPVMSLGDGRAPPAARPGFRPTHTPRRPEIVDLRRSDDP